MELTLDRIAKRNEYTIGHLYLGGVYFCDTLEDKVRELGKDGNGKIKGMTAIPAGRYRVRMDIVSPEGCILVGENKAKGRVLNSTATYKRLWYALEEINKRNEKIYITIR